MMMQHGERKAVGEKKEKTRFVLRAQFVFQKSDLKKNCSNFSKHERVYETMLLQPQLK